MKRFIQFGAIAVVVGLVLTFVSGMPQRMGQPAGEPDAAIRAAVR